MKSAAMLMGTGDCAIYYYLKKNRKTNFGAVTFEAKLGNINEA